jgi:hypothetical protein
MRSLARRIVDRRVLHLIKMWLECAVEETDDRGRKTRSTEAKEKRRGIPQKRYPASVFAFACNAVCSFWTLFGVDRLPNLLSLTTSCVCLELRPLPSTGVPRLQRYYEPLRHPKAPGPSLAGVRLIIPDHASGLPVLRALPLCTCCRHYPGAATGIASALSPSRSSLPRYGRRVGPRIVLFEACSAFTRVTGCTLALSPYVVTRLTEGFNDFVTSIVAPVASGWSSRRVGLAPTGKAPPSHGARQKRSVECVVESS